MQRLINSLLDINRLEAGQPIANRKPTPVTELVNDAVDAVKPNCESRRQTLLISLDSDLPPVFVDADMVRRVLINLLENATKYTPSDSKIEIGARSEGGTVTFWVQDYGQGIPDEAQERIFDRFVRLQGERFPRGLGLGLSFCRLAVQAHGGKIWVESQMGQGSRFVFLLPVAKSS
jgi:signal transduction histidine kinase